MSKKIMKSSEKTTWTSALKSGAFKQGGAALRNESNEFCCLGVAAKSISGRCTVGTFYLKDGRYGLPIKLQNALGQANDGVDPAETRRSFQACGFKTAPRQRAVNPRSNRFMRASFAEIAKWIENNL